MLPIPRLPDYAALDRVSFRHFLKEAAVPTFSRYDDPDTVDTIFNALDVNRDGVLDVNEFLAGAGVLDVDAILEDRLKMLFDACDDQNDGHTNTTQLKHVYTAAFNLAGDDVDNVDSHHLLSSAAKDLGLDEARLSLDDFIQLADASPAFLNCLTSRIPDVLRARHRDAPASLPPGRPP